MRRFIFTYDRPQTITTTAVFDDANETYTLLLHSAEKAQEYAACGKYNKNNAEIVITGKPRGLAHQRNAALEMMQEDEWALFVVDDLTQLMFFEHYHRYSQPDEHYKDRVGITAENANDFANSFKHDLDLSYFLETICPECIQRADREGAYLVGFAAYENHFFLDKKWKNSGLADGRCWLVKKSHLRFDPEVHTIDDYFWTALNLETFGKVLINQWVIPKCERYTKGGYGTKEERMEQKIKDCAYLVNRFPSIVHYAEKKGWPPGSHVQIRYRAKQEPEKKDDNGQGSVFDFFLS